MSARVIIDVTVVAGRGEIHLRALDIPVTDRYPDGVKYRFQYVGPEGRPLLRYDNFPDHPGAPLHHRHTRAGVEAVDYDGLEEHVQKFLAAVSAYRR